MLRVEDQASRSDTGRQRSANEDSYFVRSPIFVVADGMGGAQAGEVASKAAADSFDRDLPEGSPEAFLRETIESANRKIHDLARDDPSKTGMGTTITAVVVAHIVLPEDLPSAVPAIALGLIAVVFGWLGVRTTRLSDAEWETRFGGPTTIAGDRPKAPTHQP